VLEGSFRWLKLSPSGKEIVPEFISDVYNLTMLSNVALFLHSTIRMQPSPTETRRRTDCDHMIVRLYKSLPCSGGGEVVVYPDCVSKEVIRPPLDVNKFQSLYASIAGSRYLIPANWSPSTQRESTVAAETCWKPTFTAWCFEGFGSCCS
jgi:hypothetical protein